MERSGLAGRPRFQARAADGCPRPFDRAHLHVRRVGRLRPRRRGHTAWPRAQAAAGRANASQQGARDQLRRLPGRRRPLPRRQGDGLRPADGVARLRRGRRIDRPEDADRDRKPVRTGCPRVPPSRWREPARRRAWRKPGRRVLGLHRLRRTQRADGSAGAVRRVDRARSERLATVALPGRERRRRHALVRCAALESRRAVRASVQLGASLAHRARDLRDAAVRSTGTGAT